VDEKQAGSGCLLENQRTVNKKQGRGYVVIGYQSPVIGKSKDQWHFDTNERSE